MAETLGVTDMLPNKFEPLRKFRWVLAIEGIDAFLIKTAARPQSTFEVTTIDWINSKRFLPGKHTFAPIAVTLYDAIAPSASQEVMEWLRLQFEVVSGRSGYNDFLKRDIQLKLLDPLGSVVQLWDGKGCWIESANFGDLDYASSDAMEITLSIQADLWTLQF